MWVTIGFMDETFRLGGALRNLVGLRGVLGFSWRIAQEFLTAGSGGLPLCNVPRGWVLPPLRNSWIILMIWLYIALNRTPNIDCYKKKTL